MNIWLINRWALPGRYPSRRRAAPGKPAPGHRAIQPRGLRELGHSAARISVRRQGKWSKQAADDLAGIVTFICQDSPTASERVAEAIFQSTRSLAQFPPPGSRRPRRRNTRASAAAAALPHRLRRDRSGRGNRENPARRPALAIAPQNHCCKPTETLAEEIVNPQPRAERAETPLLCRSRPGAPGLRLRLRQRGRELSDSSSRHD